MSKEKANVPAVKEEPGLPATYSGDESVFAQLSGGTEFLDRLQLYQGSSNAVKEDKIQVGHWGIPQQDESVLDLGKEVQLMVFARRPKALDTSDRESIIENFDPGTETFLDIQARADDKQDENSGCMYGITFLIFERQVANLLEFFASSTSLRIEAKKLFPFLPRTSADVERERTLAKEQGLDPDKIAGPRPATPMSMKSFLKKGKKYSWFVPSVSPCSTPFTNLPSQDVIGKAMTTFLTKKSTDVQPEEEVEEGEEAVAR